MGFFTRMKASWGKSSRLQELQKIVASPDGNRDDLVAEFRRSMGGVLSEKDRALEEFFDLCESDVGVKNVMAAENLSRADLKQLYARLLFAGLGQWIEGHYVALSTIAYVEPLQYLARSEKKGVGWQEICFNLLEYWGGRIPSGGLLRLNKISPAKECVEEAAVPTCANVAPPDSRINYAFAAPKAGWGTPVGFPKSQDKLLESLSSDSPPSKPKTADCLTLPSGERLTRSQIMAAHRSLPPTRTTRSRTTPLITPVQEQEVLPVLVRLFDAAFRLGYSKFKDAAKFALDNIRAAMGEEVANAITLEHLQGAYISMSSGKPGVDGIRAVSNIEDKSVIEGHMTEKSI